jgi:hypothetical protein
VSVELGLPVTLRDEHRLRVVRGIFGPKMDEIIGGRRKLRTEFRNLDPSPE